MGKILVVLTGGTIGSRIDSNTIDVSVAAAYDLIRFYEKRYGKQEEFEVISPLNILSENCTPNDWSVLVKALQGVSTSEYEGIIVTHGTDTLAYTSALLGYLFGKISIPMVVIASNYALSEPQSNGVDNFGSAVSLIREKKYRGVFTIFQNAKKENMVYLPTRIMEADSYLDQFSSFGGCDLGIIQDKHFQYYNSPMNPDISSFFARQVEPMPQQNIEFQANILKIHPYPGMNYENISLNPKPAAILHLLYHSGTGCVVGNQYSMLEFLKECHEKGIDVYVASIKKEEDQYASCREIIEMGVNPLFHISEIAAYAKLQVAYNQTEIEPRKYMQQSIYYESIIE